MNLEAAAPGPPRLRPRSQAPWNWTDILLFVLLAYLVLPIGSVLFGVIAQVLDAGLSDRLRHALQSLAETAGVYTAWVAVVLVLVLVRRRARISQLGWRSVTATRLLVGLVLCVPIAGATLLLGAWLTELSSWLLPHVGSGQCHKVRDQYGDVIPVALVLVSLIDPIAEETIFRGFIHGWLRGRLPLALAVPIGAAIFSAAHLDILLFLPLLGVGAVLSLVYELSGSLLFSAAVHGLFNAYNVVAILSAPNC